MGEENVVEIAEERAAQVSRWRVAVETERGYWNNVSQDDVEALRVMAYNAQAAARLRRMLGAPPASCLEIGIGGLGVGLSGFLPDVPFRVGMDPVSRVSLRSGDFFHDYLLSLRKDIRYVVAPGECIPLRSESLDLVVCVNVLDHVMNPDDVLAEIHRVLRPQGHFLLEVHCFSALGLLKWHTWTKHRYKDQPLVKAHPHRLTEHWVESHLRRGGFALLRREGHTVVSSVMGHAKLSAFLAVKR